jgi:hypothetical protein
MYLISFCMFSEQSTCFLYTGTCTVSIVDQNDSFFIRILSTDTSYGFGSLNKFLKQSLDSVSDLAKIWSATLPGWNIRQDFEMDTKQVSFMCLLAVFKNILGGGIYCSFLGYYQLHVKISLKFLACRPAEMNLLWWIWWWTLQTFIGKVNRLEKISVSYYYQ